MTTTRKDSAERMNSIVDISDDAIPTSSTSIIAPKVPTTTITKATATANGISRAKAADIIAHEARRGMLESLIMPRMVNKFSSQPFQSSDAETTTSGLSTNSSSSSPIAAASSGTPTVSATATTELMSNNKDNKGRPSLTASEKKYLELLLQSNDPDAIRQASDRLSDVSLFPRSESDESVPSSLSSSVAKTDVMDDNLTTKSSKQQQQHLRHELQHRDSELQRSLFRFHEEANVPPSTLLKRLSQHTTFNPNSNNNGGGAAGGRPTSPVDYSEKKTEPNWDTEEDDKNKNKRDKEDDKEGVEDKDTVTTIDTEWDDLMNAAAWITAESGDSIEVNDEGSPMLAHSSTTTAFKVLGTSAQDTSCFPHVLSPPIMEGLQAFVPESLTESSNFWLKYSLVRDGPGLLKMLRHVRASNHTVLAIEATDGHVFGAFTSRPWRLSKGHFGSSDSFLFRMRHSRNKHCTTVVERALLETELEFFPYTKMNNSVQCCTRDGISFGSTELLDNGGIDNEADNGEEEINTDGEYFGSALSLDKTLLSGTTSSSETFCNPCLTHSSKRGCEFEVANVEVWTLTPHDSVEKAENEELEALFFEETYSRNVKKLDLLGILVGSPYGQVHA